MYGTSGFKQFPFCIAVLFMNVCIGLWQKAMCTMGDCHSCRIIGHGMKHWYFKLHKSS